MYNFLEKKNAFSFYRSSLTNEAHMTPRGDSWSNSNNIIFVNLACSMYPWPAHKSSLGATIQQLRLSCCCYPVCVWPNSTPH